VHLEFVVHTALLTVINRIIVIPLYGTVKYIDVWIFTSFLFAACFSRVSHYQTKYLQYRYYCSNYVCFSSWKWMYMNTTAISDVKLNTYVTNASLLSFYVLYCFLLLVPYIYCCFIWSEDTLSWIVTPFCILVTLYSCCITVLPMFDSQDTLVVSVCYYVVKHCIIVLFLGCGLFLNGETDWNAMLCWQDLMSQLSVADQHEVDSLNDDIRRLTQENKEAFSTRMRLEAEKNKLENLLTNNLMRRKDELMQVQYNVAECVMCISTMWQMWYFLFSAKGGNCGFFFKIGNRWLLDYHLRTAFIHHSMWHTSTTATTYLASNLFVVGVDEEFTVLSIISEWICS